MGSCQKRAYNGMDALPTERGESGSVRETLARLISS